MLFCDGRVQTIGENISLSSWQALAGRNDGEVVGGY
jgi:hypothetical protein